MEANKEILIYHTRAIKKPQATSIVNFELWHPSFIRMTPPKKPIKYFVYSWFKWLKIFKNSCYFSCYATESSHDSVRIMSSFLVVPAYYRWPFMDRESVQFTYVMTAEKDRGKGLAWQGIYQVYTELRGKGVSSFWYVTDTKNPSSQRLASKMGFKLAGKGVSVTKCFGVIKKLKLIDVD